MILMLIHCTSPLTFCSKVNPLNSLLRVFLYCISLQADSRNQEVDGSNISGVKRQIEVMKLRTQVLPDQII